MIYKNGKLILEVSNNISKLVNQAQETVERKIGAIYKGSQLVWLTIYNVIRSCFGGGTWLSNKPWLDDDTWKNN